MRSKLKPFVAALAGGCTLFAAGAAMAQHAPGYVPGYAPGYMTAEAPAAHLMPVDLHVSIGWHGDRYWDGRRYWAHDEWMRHHPHDPGPPHRMHDDHRDDHRPPPRY
ncbi:PXPV repeat-containing protein [Paraburkholderia kururiensis]|uniref:hypothetical protein n=1 Tax=Paraburkholderia kururiensis TaxID=984307 RepID=UPI0039A524E2